MKIAYFDCFSGISGDMCLGAIVDAGAPLEEILKNLRKLPVKGYSLSEKKVRRSGFTATKVEVVLKSRVKHNSEPRKWKDIQKIIKASSLSDDIKKKGHKIFRILFEAESKVHGESINKVHLHELGGVDCLIDIFGTLIGLELLGIKSVYSSPVNLGGGTIKTVHGTIPVPAPATTEILRDVPVYLSGIPFELTTPTGAAILKSISKGFGVIPVFNLVKTAIGAGSRELEVMPNILRILIGDIYKKSNVETVTVIETNIDDMNPQIYEYLIEKLLLKGALDVYMTQVIMKKTRPGIELSVLCHKDRRDDLINLILKETTTIGVRYYETRRIKMDRRLTDVQTKYGKIRLKISKFKDSKLKYIPEYEDCKKIARESDVPLLEVFEEVRRSAKRKMKT